MKRLIALLSMTALVTCAHAQFTMSIDFESPPYTDGMAPAAFPNPPWVQVESGATVTTTNSLAGSNSLILPANTWSGAVLAIDVPNWATSLNISLLFNPANFPDIYATQAGGFIGLYKEEIDNGTYTDAHAFDLSFRLYGDQPGFYPFSSTISKIGHTYDGGSSTENIINWDSNTTYTLNINYNYVTSTMSYAVLNGMTTIDNGSGMVYFNGKDFNLHLWGGTSAGAMFDSIQISAVPEPSSYAILVGLLALGFVAVRRRQRS